MSPSRPTSRPGFTLVELMIVITVILILASMILVIRPANPEGLANGQRMLASMVRSAKAQALMNRAALPRPVGYVGPTISWNPGNFRYRVLIKNDPSDPDRHLREMVIAIGFTGVGRAEDLGRYVWFSPESSVLLPPGIFFVPPSGSVPAPPSGSPAGSAWTNSTVTMPAVSALDAAGFNANARRSIITPLEDSWQLSEGPFEFLGTSALAPRMRYRPLASPLLSTTAAAYFNSGTDPLTHAQAAGGRNWFFVELGPDGSLAHSGGRAVLVLAEGIITPGTNVGVRFERPDRFAAVLVRRNGEVALTVDVGDFQENSLK